MEQSEKDAGTLAALMIELEENCLPRALQILENVNAGEKLDDYDIEFLSRMYRDSRNNESLVERHPEYHKLISRSLLLYTEIINTGLENENK
jgi:hypothetical protein